MELLRKAFNKLKDHEKKSLLHQACDSTSARTSVADGSWTTFQRFINVIAQYNLWSELNENISESKLSDEFKESYAILYKDMLIKKRTLNVQTNELSEKNDELREKIVVLDKKITERRVVLATLRRETSK